MSLRRQLAAERAYSRSRGRGGSLRGAPGGVGAAGAGRQVLAGGPGCEGEGVPACSPETLCLGRLNMDEQDLRQHFGVSG